ncbi:hypothetical protein RR48_10774 [Papilio machaon]|uniref:Uncharacterized protein n=1 Tax=Papilio machaon TaxID=76193 RepID=A0A194R8L6_PAPMA|nr:hypothetical protein RR48_10774 [Papilio machaon]
MCTITENNIYLLCKHLDIDECQAKLLQLKQPVLKEISEKEFKTVTETVKELGFSTQTLILNPALFGVLPITLKYRYKVLEECGLQNIKPGDLLRYLNIVKQKTIGQLRSDGQIPYYLNIENRLASCMTQWPTSLTTLIYGDVNNFSLYSLRLKIIQRYLELVLDLSSDEFYRGLKTYPTIKHRPLEIINETLNILQTQIMIPNFKIKSNLYLIHADPENLKNLIYNFRFIGGIDIKEIIRSHPKIAMKNFSNMVEIRKILQEFDVSNEAQIRCFEIYTLSPETIRARLENAKKTPEFITYFNHPRFLKMIHHNKKTTKRLINLYSQNKKCVSLNILSGSFSNYETFEKMHGDRLGKAKDLLFCICEILGNTSSASDIRKILRRHPFWLNMPLVQIKYVAEQLLKKFSPEDVFENCTILLYPWNKIRDTMVILHHRELLKLHPFDHLDMSRLSDSQKLSLVLYLLEKKHYFTGNGVWTEDKNKNTELTIQTKNISKSILKIAQN